jgi:hypothetical protein
MACWLEAAGKQGGKQVQASHPRSRAWMQHACSPTAGPLPAQLCLYLPDPILLSQTALGTNSLCPMTQNSGKQSSGGPPWARSCHRGESSKVRPQRPEDSAHGSKAPTATSQAA